jgi:hypothetical protein
MKVEAGLSCLEWKLGPPQIAAAVIMITCGQGCRIQLGWWHGGGSSFRMVHHGRGRRWYEINIF